MYKRLFRKYLLAGLAVVAGMVFNSALLHAQIVGELEANIPFAFSADNTRLPAGDYFIRPAEEIGDTALEMVSSDYKVALFIMPIHTQANQMPKTSELVFDKIGNRYFLREIWVQDDQTGYSLEKSKAELRWEKGGVKTEHHRLTIKHHKKRISKP